MEEAKKRGRRRLQPVELPKEEIKKEEQLFNVEMEPEKSQVFLSDKDIDLVEDQDIDYEPLYLDLQKKNQDQKLQIENLQVQLDELKNNNNNLLIELAEWKDQHKELYMQLRQLTEQHQEVSQKLSFHERDKETAQEKLKAEEEYKNKIAQKRKELNDLLRR